MLAKAVQIVRGQFRGQLQILVGQDQTTHARVKPEREQECPTSIQHHADMFGCVQYFNNKNNEREKEREREREKQTDRQRQTETEKETERDRERERKRERQRERQRERGVTVNEINNQRQKDYITKRPE